MLAIVAAVLFALALLLELVDVSLGRFVTTATLTTAGLLCVALHLSGVAAHRKAWRRRR
ncbi:hypothetical protein ACFORO_09905 [Amycolatopsis halotolerans]|uniref:Uncharacterized protein n=2 Tax=Amycolatopsis halotolerans TaxID=330083 RepID=A0ABV7QAW6_9PSEU